MSEASPEFRPETAVTVGRIVAAHGVRGEVKVQPLTDFPERFREGAALWLEGERVRVRGSRVQGRMFVIKLEGVDDRNAAEALQGKELMAENPRELPADVFYRHDIIGLEAVTAGGESLGKVADIFSTGSNDVYVIRGDRGELLLPAIEDAVREIDVQGGRLVVELLEGLEFSAAPGQRRPQRPQRRGGRRPATSEAEDTGAGDAGSD